MRSNMPVVGIELKAPRDERGRVPVAMPRVERRRLPVNWPSFSDVAHRILAVRSAEDFAAVARGDLQFAIRHDVLIAAWGDFRLGALHYDLLATDPGIEGHNVAAGGIAPILSQLFAGWVANGRQPLRMDVSEFSDAWGRGGVVPGAVPTMAGMRSVVLHGILDQRGHADCLYAFFNTIQVPDRDDTDALKLLVPYIDVALRQVQAPSRQPGAAGVAGAAVKVVKDDSRLSEREAEIMKWVAMGKTNVEIGSILNLSSFTIKNHMQRIFKKLDVFNRAQAVSVFKSRHGSNPQR